MESTWRWAGETLPLVDPLTAWPTIITAGTTVKVLRSHSDFPAGSGWALRFWLAGPNVIDGGVAGVADGDSFLITLTPEITKKLGPGSYRWREIVTLAGETFVAASGVLEVEANIAAMGAGDILSFYERSLVVVEAAISGQLADDMQSYQIANRTVALLNHKELWALHASLTAKIAALREPTGFGRTIEMEIVRP